MKRSDAISLLLLAMMFAAALGWIARGRYDGTSSAPEVEARPAATSPGFSRRTPRAGGRVWGGPSDASPPLAATEPLAPPHVLAAIGSVARAMTSKRDSAEPRPIIVPVVGVSPSAMRDMFDEARGDHRHEAIDILAPRGTAVIAADDGVVKKLFTSVAGGITVYQFDPAERFCYYYAHLDRYADDLHEGQMLHRGEILGYVGTTGNAPENTPHLHFALIRLDPDKRWWKGTYVNPYPLLVRLKTR